MNSFVYNIPTRVYFGPDQLGNLGKEVSVSRKRALLYYDSGSVKESSFYDRAVAQLKAAGMEMFELFGIGPNPKISPVNTDTDIYEKERIDMLLAVSGGSVFDCTRYTGVVAYYDGDGRDILLDKVPVEQRLPTAIVLALAATDSEMDSGGVINNPGTKGKIGRMFPPTQSKVSFLDPTEIYSVSKHQTARGSFDILSRLLEIYFVPEGGSMHMLDCFMEDMIKTVVKYAPIAMKQPDHYEARANLMWTSSWAINGFAGTLQNYERTCHPIEHELFAIYDITHGLGLAIVTPRQMRCVLDVITAHRFYRHDVNMFGTDSFLPEMEVTEESTEMTADFLSGEPGSASALTEIDIDDSNLNIMAEKACGGGILQGYKPLNREDVRKILTVYL